MTRFLLAALIMFLPAQFIDAGQAEIQQERESRQKNIAEKMKAITDLQGTESVILETLLVDAAKEREELNQKLNEHQAYLVGDYEDFWEKYYEMISNISDDIKIIGQQKADEFYKSLNENLLDFNDLVKDEYIDLLIDLTLSFFKEFYIRKLIENPTPGGGEDDNDGSAEGGVDNFDQVLVDMNIASIMRRAQEYTDDYIEKLHRRDIMIGLYRQDMEARKRYFENLKRKVRWKKLREEMEKKRKESNERIRKEEQERKEAQKKREKQHQKMKQEALDQLYKSMSFYKESMDYMLSREQRKILDAASERFSLLEDQAIQEQYEREMAELHKRFEEEEKQRAEEAVLREQEEARKQAEREKELSAYRQQLIEQNLEQARRDQERIDRINAQSRERARLKKEEEKRKKEEEQAKSYAEPMMMYN